MSPPKISPCPGCGTLLEDRAGPTHRYLESSPACWAIYGEVLAREYSTPELMEVHRFSVDAYAVQHPGKEASQTINSAAVHLMRLCLLLEQGLEMKHANDVISSYADHKHSYDWLTPPASKRSLTVLDVWKTSSVAEHKRMVREWAMSAWQAWSDHHAIIRQWLARR